MDLGQILGNV